MKRTCSILFSILLSVALAVPALAAGGQIQTLLRATDDDGYICKETSLGSYAADTLRQAAGTDFAMLPSELLGLNLQAGIADETAIAQSFPQDEAVYVVSLTSAELREILETACAHLTLDETEHLDKAASQWGGFLQLSGLHVIYNVSSPAGQRLYSVKLDDATELDMTDDATRYTAAVPASMLDGTYGYPEMRAEREVGALRELVAARIAAEGVTEEPSGKRIILYGARENEIIGYFSPVFIIFVIVLMAFFGGHKWRRAVNFER